MHAVQYGAWHSSKLTREVTAEAWAKQRSGHALGNQRPVRAQHASVVGQQQLQDQQAPMPQQQPQQQIENN
jgi:hypothetical protein